MRRNDEADWTRATPKGLLDAVVAVRKLFLTESHAIQEMRKRGAVRSLLRNRVSKPSAVLAPWLRGWKQLLVDLATRWFAKFMAMAINHDLADFTPIQWADLQTRHALNEALGTLWFTGSNELRHARSSVVLAWLRHIDEAVFQAPKHIPSELPDPTDNDAWKDLLLAEIRWQAHAWLAGLYNPKLKIDDPFAPLPDESRDVVVETLTLDLLSDVESGLQHTVDLAEIHRVTTPLDRGHGEKGSETDDKASSQRNRPDKLDEGRASRPSRSKREKEKGRPPSQTLAIRQEAIRVVAASGARGERYCRQLDEVRLGTPLEWQKRDGCPKNYVDAWNHPIKADRKKWRHRIADEKSKATTASRKNSPGR